MVQQFLPPAFGTPLPMSIPRGINGYIPQSLYEPMIAPNMLVQPAQLPQMGLGVPQAQGAIPQANGRAFRVPPYVQNIQPTGGRGMMTSRGGPLGLAERLAAQGQGQGLLAGSPGINATPDANGTYGFGPQQPNWFQRRVAAMGGAAGERGAMNIPFMEGSGRAATAVRGGGARLRAGVGNLGSAMAGAVSPGINWGQGGLPAWTQRNNPGAWTAEESAAVRGAGRLTGAGRVAALGPEAGRLAQVGARSGWTGGGIGGAARTGLGRVGLALPMMMAGGALSSALGGEETSPGRFASGATAAGVPGFVAGGPVAGAVAAPIGGAANVITGGQFTRSLGELTGQGEEAQARAGINEALEAGGAMNLPGADGQMVSITPEQISERLEGLLDFSRGDSETSPLVNLPDEERQAIITQYEDAIEGTDADDPERLAALEQAARASLMVENGVGTALPQDAAARGMGLGEMMPQDLAAMQMMASQYFAPVAADAAAIGDMQATALQQLAPSLPGEFQPIAQSMAGDARQKGQGVANAFIQQAYSLPSQHIQGRQMAIQDQIANQLAQQAMSTIPQLQTPSSGGGGDLSALIEGAIAGG